MIRYGATIPDVSLVRSGECKSFVLELMYSPRLEYLLVSVKSVMTGAVDYGNGNHNKPSVELSILGAGESVWGGR